MMTQKNKLVDRQALLDEQNIKVDKREKKHEDDLLRKLQQEKVRESIDSITKMDNKDANREHFEDTLLEKLMASMMSDDHSTNDLGVFQRNQGELLMITSAVALTEEEKEAIVRKFIKKTKKPLRRITTVVDPSLITGVRLQSESFYYEVSGQKTLRELRRHLDRNWRE